MGRFTRVKASVFISGVLISAIFGISVLLPCQEAYADIATVNGATYEYEASDGKATIISIQGNGTDVIVPANIGGYAVSEIDVPYGEEGVTSINLSQCNDLTDVYLSSNYLEEVSAEGLNKLETLICRGHKLTALNTSGLISLKWLGCYNSHVLTRLDLSHLSNLETLCCDWNTQLETLSLTGLRNLKRLECDYSNLTALDLSGLNSLESLYCPNNKLTSLNLSGLTKLSRLDCSDNDLKSLDLAGLKNLRSLNCRSNEIASLDVTKLNELVSLDCGSNQLSSLDISGLAKLDYLNCRNNSIAETTLLEKWCETHFSEIMPQFVSCTMEEYESRFPYYYCPDTAGHSVNPYGYFSQISINKTYSGKVPEGEAIHKRFTLPHDCEISLETNLSWSLYNINKSKKEMKRIVDYKNHKGENYLLENGDYLLELGGGYGQPYSFKVNVPPFANSLASATVTIGTKTFSNRRFFPSSITVKLNSCTLRKGIDYTVNCKGGVSVGTYKVTIEGKGAYTGTKTATFKIIPKGTSITKLAKGKRSLTVIWMKLSKSNLKQLTGYEVRYSISKSMKNAKIVKIKGASKTTAKLKKLKAGKKYYIEIRTYKKIGNELYYSSWSKAKNAKSKK